ncbi:hypothetical protein CIRMBP1309_01752 [Enterococcus cecorum]|nr:hypothetical protein CIRMBP1309_01752 [Enterococcus cecorum]
MKKGGITSTRPLVKKTKGLFYFKDVRRVDQLRADKVCPTRRESPKSKDFSRRGGLYAEVASRRTQIALRS